MSQTASRKSRNKPQKARGQAPQFGDLPSPRPAVARRRRSPFSSAILGLAMAGILAGVNPQPASAALLDLELNGSNQASVTLSPSGTTGAIRWTYYDNSAASGGSNGPNNDPTVTITGGSHLDSTSLTPTYATTSSTGLSLGPIGLAESFLILGPVMGVENDDILGDVMGIEITFPLDLIEITGAVVVPQFALLGSGSAEYTFNVDTEGGISIKLAENSSDVATAHNYAGVYSGYTGAPSAINYGGEDIKLDISRSTDNTAAVTGLFGIYNAKGNITIGKDGDIEIISEGGINVNNTAGALTNGTQGAYILSVISGAATSQGDITANGKVTISGITQSATTDVGGANVFGLTSGLSSAGLTSELTLSILPSPGITMNLGLGGGSVTANELVQLKNISYEAINGGTGYATATGLTTGIISQKGAEFSTIDVINVSHIATSDSGDSTAAGLTGGLVALGGDAIGSEIKVNGVTYQAETLGGSGTAYATGITVGAATLGLEELTGLDGIDLTNFNISALDDIVLELSGGEVTVGDVSLSDIEYSATQEGVGDARTISLSAGVFSMGDATATSIDLDGLTYTSAANDGHAQTIGVTVGALALGASAELALDLSGGGDPVGANVTLNGGDVETGGIIFNDLQYKATTDSGPAEAYGVTVGAFAGHDFKGITGGPAPDVTFSNLSHAAVSGDGVATAGGLVIGAAALGIENIDLLYNFGTAPANGLEASFSGGDITAGQVGFNGISFSATSNAGYRGANVYGVTAGLLALGQVTADSVGFDGLTFESLSKEGEALTVGVALGAAALGVGSLELGLPDFNLGGLELTLGLGKGNVTVADTISMNNLTFTAESESDANSNDSAQAIGLTVGALATGEVAAWGLDFQGLNHGAYTDSGFASAYGVVVGAAALGIGQGTELVYTGGAFGDSEFVLNGGDIKIAGPVNFGTVNAISFEAVSTSGAAEAYGLTVGGLALGQFTADSLNFGAIAHNAVVETGNGKASAAGLVIGAAALGVESTITTDFASPLFAEATYIGGKPGLNTVDITDGLTFDNIFFTASADRADADSAAMAFGLTAGALATGVVSVGDNLTFDTVAHEATSGGGYASAYGLVVGAAALGAVSAKDGYDPTDPETELALTGGKISLGGVSFGEGNGITFTAVSESGAAEAYGLTLAALATGEAETGNIHFGLVSHSAKVEEGDGKASATGVVGGVLALGLADSSIITNFTDSIALDTLNLGQSGGNTVETEDITFGEIIYKADTSATGTDGLATAFGLTFGVLTSSQAQTGNITFNTISHETNSYSRYASTYGGVLGVGAFGSAVVEYTGDPDADNITLAGGNITTGNLSFGAGNGISFTAESYDEAAEVYGLTGGVLGTGTVIAGDIIFDNIKHAATVTAAGGDAKTFGLVLGAGALDVDNVVVTNFTTLAGLEINSTISESEKALTAEDVIFKNLSFTAESVTGSAGAYGVAIGAMANGDVNLQSLDFSDFEFSAAREGSGLAGADTFGLTIGAAALGLDGLRSDLTVATTASIMGLDYLAEVNGSNGGADGAMAIGLTAGLAAMGDITVGDNTLNLAEITIKAISNEGGFAEAYGLTAGMLSLPFDETTGDPADKSILTGPVNVKNVAYEATATTNGALALGITAGDIALGSVLVNDKVTVEGVSYTAGSTHADWGSYATAGGLTGGILALGNIEAEGDITVTGVTYETTTADGNAVAAGLVTGAYSLFGAVVTGNSTVTVAADSTASSTTGEALGMISAYGLRGEMVGAYGTLVNVSATGDDYGLAVGLRADQYGQYDAASDIIPSLRVGNQARISATGSTYAFALSTGTFQNDSPVGAPDADVEHLTVISGPVTLSAKSNLAGDNIYTEDPILDGANFSSIPGLLQTIINEENMKDLLAYTPMPVKEAEYLGLGTNDVIDFEIGAGQVMDNGGEALRIFGAEVVNISSGTLKMAGGSYFINQVDFDYGHAARAYGEVDPAADARNIAINVESGATLHIAGFMKRTLTKDDGGAHQSRFTLDDGSGNMTFDLGKDYFTNLTVDDGGTLMFSVPDLSKLAQGGGTAANPTMYSQEAMFYVSEAVLDGNFTLDAIENVYDTAAGSYRVHLLEAESDKTSPYDNFIKGPGTPDGSVVVSKLFYDYTLENIIDGGPDYNNNMNGVFLDFTRNNKTLSGVANGSPFSHNDRYAARAWDRFDVSTSSLKPIKDALYNANNSRHLWRLVNQLHPEVVVSAADAASRGYLMSLSGVNNLILDSAYPETGGWESLYPAYGQSGDSPWSLRFRVTGGHGSLDGERHADYDLDAWSGVVALERALENNFTLGAALNVGRSDTDFQYWGSNSDSEDIGFNLYGRYRCDNWYLAARAGFGRSDVEVKRHLPDWGVRASSDFKVNYFAASILTGYEHMLDSGWILNPNFELSYLQGRMKSVRERGAGLFNQRIQGDTKNSLDAHLNLEVKKAFELDNGGIVAPRVNIGVANEFGDRQFKTTSTFIADPAFPTYQVHSPETGRFRVTAGAGLDAHFTDQVGLSLDYQGSFRDNYNEHLGQLSLKLSW